MLPSKACHKILWQALAGNISRGPRAGVTLLHNYRFPEILTDFMQNVLKTFKFLGIVQNAWYRRRHKFNFWGTHATILLSPPLGGTRSCASPLNFGELLLPLELFSCAHPRGAMACRPPQLQESNTGCDGAGSDNGDIYWMINEKSIAGLLHCKISGDL